MNTLIEKIELRLFRVPVTPPRGDAIQKFSFLELPVVTITDAGGNKGVGFSYTIGQGGVSICRLIRESLVLPLLGQDARRISYLHHFLKKSIHALTEGVIASDALSAIDVALWDLKARRAVMPLHVLLGGAKSRVPIYNTDVGWLDRPLDEMLEQCRQATAGNRFKAVKIKVGKPDPEEDVERIAKIRETVGPKTRIMIDANQSWTIDEAIGRILSLEPFDLTWVEEPLLATDIQGYQTLGKHTRIPRAGGESLYSSAAFYEYLRQGALDILQPDVSRVGGITSAMEVCNLAHSAGLRVAPHVSPELSTVLGCAVTNSMYVEFIPQMQPVLKSPVRIIEGYAIPFEKPGHGIEFEESKLSPYEVNDEYFLTESENSREVRSPRAS